MPQYRKKPVIIEAVQFTYPPTRECVEFCGDGLRNIQIARHPGAIGQADITTIHGETAVVREGDWIIPESVPGRFYPCKPDIFAATYEAVDNDYPIDGVGP